MGVLLPAVGLAWELLPVGGELGPDSGLLPESKKIIVIFFLLVTIDMWEFNNWMEIYF